MSLSARSRCNCDRSRMPASSSAVAINRTGSTAQSARRSDRLGPRSSGCGPARSGASSSPPNSKPRDAGLAPVVNDTANSNYTESTEMTHTPLPPLPHHLDRNVVIEAPPDIVFRFFTDAGRWASWWGAGSTIDAKPGGSLLIRRSIQPDRRSGRAQRTNRRFPAFHARASNGTPGRRAPLPRSRAGRLGRAHFRESGAWTRDERVCLRIRQEDRSGDRLLDLADHWTNRPSRG
jgi:hypothetical protein